MKSLSIHILALCFMICSPGYVLEAKEHARCKSDCANVHTITQRHFNGHHKHSKTLVITKPGNYCLAETIRWCPKKRNKTAIIIDSSNVTLDLSGHELKQVNGQGRCSGILVTSGHDTVKIVNGAVRDFTQLGIVVEGGTSNIFLGNNDTVLKVTGCGYGSTYSFFDDVDQEAILQGGIQLGQTQALAGRGYYTWQGNVDTAVLTNVFAEENGPVGMYLGTGTNIDSENCFFCRNADGRQAGNTNALALGSADETWSYAIGLLYVANKESGDVDSSSIDFTNCHFDENKVTGAIQACGGMLAGYNINGLTVRGCTFNSNNGKGALNGSGRGTSGALLGGCQGFLFEDSQANNNYCENNRAEGFHLSGYNGTFDNITSPLGVIFRRCAANGNVSSGTDPSPIAVGFNLFYMNGITIEDCVALNNIALSSDPTSFGYADGLSIAGFADLEFGDVSDIVVSGCHFSGNKTNCPNGDVEGIYLQAPLTNLAIKNCVVQDNNGIDFNSGIWVAGLSDGTMRGIVIEDCVIENQSLGIYSNGDDNSIYQNNTITNVDYGVLLDGSSCNSINNNYVTNAVNGFVDVANPSSSLFSNNRVFGAATPYDVTYAFGPLPVVSGSLVTGFPTGAEVLDNVFMDNPTCTAVPVAAAASSKGALKAKAAKALKMRQGQMDKFLKR